MVKKISKEVNYLGQDIYCRYLAKESLSPEGDIQEIARQCIALASEFFIALEGNLEAIEETERKAQAHELASALMVELRGASTNGSATPEAPAATPTEAPATPLPATRGKIRQRQL